MLRLNSISNYNYLSTYIIIFYSTIYIEYNESRLVLLYGYVNRINYVNNIINIINGEIIFYSVHIMWCSIIIIITDYDGNYRRCFCHFEKAPQNRSTAYKPCFACLN